MRARQVSRIAAVAAAVAALAIGLPIYAAYRRDIRAARARIASPVLGSAANGTDATRNSKASDQPNRAARGQAIVDTPELANTDHMIIYCGQVGKPGPRARNENERRRSRRG